MLNAQWFTMLYPWGMLLPQLGELTKTRWPRNAKVENVPKIGLFNLRDTPRVVALFIESMKNEFYLGVANHLDSKTM